MNKLFTKIAGLSLGLAMAIGVGVGLGQREAKKASADTNTVVFTVKGWAGKSDNKYITTSTEGTGKVTGKTDTIKASMIQFNPSTGQVKGNQTSVGNQWSMYNSDAIPGPIRSIVVSQTETGSNKFQNQLYVALGTTSQSSVDSVTGLNSSTASVSSHTFSNLTGANTYFKLLSNVKFAAGTIKGVTITVTYEISSKLNVSYNANGATSGTVPTDSNEYDSGNTVTVLGNTGNLVKTGYSFGGWNTKADGSGNDYTAGSTFSITQNTNLYAKWVEKTVASLSFTDDAPTRTDFFDGEKYSCDGLKLKVTYNDESFDIVPISAADSVTINPEYASLTDTSISVSATLDGKTANKVINVKVSENKMTLSWDAKFNDFYYRGDVISSTDLGTVTATYDAATKDHAKIVKPSFGQYTLGLYASKSDKTPAINIASLPYVLTMEGNGKYIGVSYNGKTSFKLNALVVKNWRNVFENTSKSATISYIDTEESITGELVVSTEYGGYSEIKNSEIRFASGKQAGSLTITADSNVSMVEIVAKAYDSDETTMNVNSKSYDLGDDYPETPIKITDLSSATVTISANSGKRFYLKSVTITCGGMINVGKTQDCLGLEVFVDNYMHMSDYDPELHVGQDGAGYCKDTAHNYYGKAKEAFNGLNEHQRSLFTSNEAYLNEYKRLVAWATANGDYINGNNSLASLSNTTVFGVLTSENSSSSILIITLSVICLCAAGGYFYYRKRKEN